ncbi:MAG: hypothetical protein LBL95_03285, partial [Deltaproteobacteria bacterium]|nr:hypothetical protein [Deltaproteobacteria bacterium]
MKLARVVLAAILLAILAASPGLAQFPFLSKLMALSEKYTGPRLRLEKADDSGSWIPFTRSEKAKVQTEIDDYLDDALSILLDDSLVKRKNRIKQLQRANRELEEEIAVLIVEKTAAPTSTKFYEVWKSSTGDIERKISDGRREISGNRSLIEKEMRTMGDELAAADNRLSHEQINSIFITVSGEDQLYGIIVLKNLYSICDILKVSMAESNNLAVNKKYYGVFLLAAEAHKRQLLQNMDNIENVYLPRLANLQGENRELMAQTRSLASENPIYQGNLEAQMITDKVADQFRDLLKDQTRIIEARLRPLEEIIRHTENTFKTVSLASSLSEAMDQSIFNLQALLEIPVVPPLAF